DIPCPCLLSPHSVILSRTPSCFIYSFFLLGTPVHPTLPFCKCRCHLSLPASCDISFCRQTCHSQKGPICSTRPHSLQDTQQKRQRGSLLLHLQDSGDFGCNRSPVHHMIEVSVGDYCTLGAVC
ncbi:hypothetical protein NDU88_006361, partial [Pleurodeles waltl]